MNSTAHLSANAQCARACELHDADIVPLTGADLDAVRAHLYTMDDADIDAAIAEVRAAGFSDPELLTAHAMSIAQQVATDVASFTTAARSFAEQVAQQHGLTMDSIEMRRRITLNPSNLPGHPQAPAMAPMHAAQARCEDEGRRAYPTGRNPYMARTAAAVWWANGWHRADAEACPEMQA